MLLTYSVIIVDGDNNTPYNKNSYYCLYLNMLYMFKTPYHSMVIYVCVMLFITILVFVNRPRILFLPTSGDYMLTFQRLAWLSKGT